MSQMKHSHWFPHPANLRNDRRMKRAMRDLPGAVGYGAILLLIEHLRCEPNYSYPMKDLDILADDLKISLPIIKTVINSYGFFCIQKDENQELLFSPMLNDLMAPYLEKKEKNRTAGILSAQRRKSKQEQQLFLLSQLDSSQHVLNTSDTNAQQKIEEKKRKKDIKLEKNLPIYDFKIFKKIIIQNFKDQIICYGPSTYLDTTPISVTKLGYLHNEITKKDLIPDDAKEVWLWIFENQSLLVTKK